MRMYKRTEVTVFSKEWFELYQPQLLWLANNSTGRDLLGLHERFGYQELKGLKIVKISPSAIHIKVGDGRAIALTRVRDKYANNLAERFKWLWKAAHWFDMNVANKYMPAFNLGFDTYTGSPDTGSGGTTCDGFVGFNALNVWNVLRNAATGNSASVTSTVTSVRIDAAASFWQIIFRALWNFDISSVPVGATVNEGANTKLTLRQTGQTNTFTVNSFGFALCAATPAAVNNITTADYDQFGTTAFSSTIAYSSLAGNGNDEVIQLNTAGIAGLNLGGVTTLGMREANYDLAGVEPTQEASKRVELLHQTADDTVDPVLSIDFTAAGGEGVIITNIF